MKRKAGERFFSRFFVWLHKRVIASPLPVIARSETTKQSIDSVPARQLRIRYPAPVDCRGVSDDTPRNDEKYTRAVIAPPPPRHCEE